MNRKTERNQNAKWRVWIAPTVVSFSVFGILTAAGTVSSLLAVVIASLIVVGGVILLKTL